MSDTFSDVDSVVDSVIESYKRPKSLIPLSKMDAEVIAKNLEYFSDTPLNSHEARTGLARCICKLNEAKLMVRTFPTTTFLLARLSLQEVNFRVNLQHSSLSCTTFCFLSDKVATGCLHKPEFEFISSQFDNIENVVEVLHIFLAIKQNNFQDLLKFLKRPVPGLKDQEWLVRALFDCCRSSFENSVLREVLTSSGIPIPKTNIHSFQKKAIKRKFRH